MARSTRRLGNVPAEATSFTGRRREIAEIRSKLQAARLVNLVGPGGVGKTRLAIRCAKDLARAFAAGAWLVELAEVQQVGNAVLNALDLRNQTAREPDDLALEYLREKQLLLVVDNCEHLLDPVSRLLARIIYAAPGVRIIATSREPLSIAGEYVVPVPPLELPLLDASLDRLRLNESVALFTERAAAASGRFELTESNCRTVAELCNRLDGIPLAIELAAVRVRTLSLDQIVDRLSDRFGLLSGGNRAALPRHQTLRATIEWSYALLNASERTQFRSLGVFGGRFTLDDVATVCASQDPLEVLSSLVDKSLVIKDQHGALPCYRLHEMMREYAVLELRAAGEADVIEQKYMDYYISRGVQSASEAQSHFLHWLHWTELEIDNIHTVLRRGADAHVMNALVLASCLSWYWSTRAPTEGATWLDQLLSRAGEMPVPAFASFARGFLGVVQGDPTSALAALDRAIVATRASGELQLLALSLSAASAAHDAAGEHDVAAMLLDEASIVVSELDDLSARLGILHAQALHGLFVGDLASVEVAASECERLARAFDYTYVLELALSNRGLVALLRGDSGAARSMLSEALRIAQRIDDRVGQVYGLDSMACLAIGSGQATLGAHLLGAAETIRRGTGARVMAFVDPLLAQAEASAVARLGAARFAAELEAGRQLGREDAIRMALGERSTVAAPRSSAREPLDGSLAKRETEVAGLVADGLSNKQIGTRLLISERTVEGHVRSILNKLGFNSRAQIAGWVRSSNR